MGNASAAAPTTKGKFKRGFCLIPDRPDIYSNQHRYDKFRDLPEATYPVNAVAVAEVAAILAAATLGTTDEVHLWDLITKELKVSLHAHSSHVWDLEFSPNETTLATASNDHTIRLWDTYTGEPIGILKEHTQGVRTLSFSPAGYLLTGGIDSLMCLWEFDNPEPVQKWKAHEGDVHGVKFSQADAFAAFSVGADGSIALWNVMDGENGLITRFAGGEGGGVLCVASHPTELSVVAAGNQDGAVWLWHFNPSSEGGPQNTGNQLRGHKGPVWSVAFSQDGCLMASGSSDGVIRVWLTTNLHAPILVSMLPAHDSWVRQVHFGPMNRIFSCSVDGKVREFLSPKALRNLARQVLPEVPDPDADPQLDTGTLLPEQVGGGAIQADVTGGLGLDALPAEGDSLGDALRAAAQVESTLPQDQPPPPTQPPPPKSWKGPAPPREPPPGTQPPWELRPPPRPPPPGAAFRSGTLLPPFVPLDKQNTRKASTLLPPVPPAPPPPPTRKPGPP